MRGMPRRLHGVPLSALVVIAAALAWIAASPGAARSAPPPPSAVQEAEAPRAIEALLGGWVGEGSLMGRPARFEMQWSRVLGGRFLRLDFSNAFVSEEGEESPVIAATAYYRIEDGTVTGSWFDTRGVILPLAGTVSDTELRVRWGDPDSAERGRTTYRLEGPDAVEVLDEVANETGEYGVFATARYVRS